MGKKFKVQKVNVSTDTAKNPDPTPETPINESDHHVAEAEAVGGVSKKPSNHNPYVRRSGRLQNVIKHVHTQVVEQIDLEESEKEDIIEQPCNQDLVNRPTPNQNIGDETVHHLVKALEEYKSKDINESTSVGLIYKSLYLDSQKKIEALTSENHDLTRKLEIVLAKLEVYENINKSTQVSNLEKAIETLVRPASYFGGGHVSDAEVAVAKEESAKKRRYDHVI